MTWRWLGFRPPSRPMQWLVVVLVLLVGQSALADSRTRVAILPMVVHATEDRDYLRSGLADMLASRLGTEKGIAVLRIDEPEAATTDATAAQAAGRAAGAQWVLFGSFTRFGEGASLDVRCVPVAGDAGHPQSVFVQAGTLGDIIPRLDNLAKRVAHHVTSGRSTLPEVAAEGEVDNDMADALSELDALRARVEALEKQVFSREDTEGGDTAAR